MHTHGHMIDNDMCISKAKILLTKSDNKTTQLYDPLKCGERIGQGPVSQLKLTKASLS